MIIFPFSFFFFLQSMAYVVCGMMDNGFKDFQLEAAISKIYASVRTIFRYWKVVSDYLASIHF